MLDVGHRDACYKRNSQGCERLALQRYQSKEDNISYQKNHALYGASPKGKPKSRFWS
jgi:hypothetical protein